MKAYFLLLAPTVLKKRIREGTRRAARIARPFAFGLTMLSAFVVTPSIGRGCACGCGVFEVGTASMFPERPGTMIFGEYDFQDQNRNWSGNSRAPAANNADKEIKTHFVTTGFQYMFNRSWGMQLEVPYVNRTFKTLGGASGDEVVSLRWGELGDIRLKGIYTGFSPDLSTGVTFGVKLPTGDYKHTDPAGEIDRDTQIGSGSTDLLLGGFHRQNLTRDGKWVWFAQAELDLPVFTQDAYRPGIEVDATAGLYYRGWSFHGAKIRPIAQVVVSERTRDTGANSADPVASGYQRVLLSPGFEVDMHPIKLDGSVEFPVFQHVTGNQVVAPALFKVSISYMF